MERKKNNRTTMMEAKKRKKEKKKKWTTESSFSFFSLLSLFTFSFLSHNKSNVHKQDIKFMYVTYYVVSDEKWWCWWHIDPVLIKWLQNITQCTWVRSGMKAKKRAKKQKTKQKNWGKVVRELRVSRFLFWKNKSWIGEYKNWKKRLN